MSIDLLGHWSRWCFLGGTLALRSDVIAIDVLHAPCSPCCRVCVGAKGRLRSHFSRMHFEVRKDEPIRCGEFCPAFVQSIFYRRSISTFGPGGSGPCVQDTYVLLRCFRDSQCMYTPRCSFWYESGVHGYVPVVSPACRAVSPMLLDVHVLWRHNC